MLWRERYDFVYLVINLLIGGGKDSKVQQRQIYETKGNSVNNVLVHLNQCSKLFIAKCKGEELILQF